MNKEFTLGFIFIALFSNNIYAYNSNNSCEKLLKNGKIKQALTAAKTVDSKYDANFCAAKAYYRLKNYQAASNAFDESSKHADLPVDQMFSFLYKGISQRDLGEVKASTATLTKGLDTAALGNSKYLQMEQRFLYQLGLSALAAKDGMTAVDYFVKSSVIAANDQERANSFKGLSQAFFMDNKVDSAIEYGVRASTTFQRTGDLGEYAEMQINLANYESVNENFPRAIRILDSLVDFAKTNGGEYFHAKALIAKSSILSKKGDAELSKTSFAEGQAIAKKIGAADLLRP
jgi:tetratricopeptide (TPR) repeat protein